MCKVILQKIICFYIKSILVPDILSALKYQNKMVEMCTFRSGHGACFTLLLLCLIVQSLIVSVLEGHIQKTIFEWLSLTSLWEVYHGPLQVYIMIFFCLDLETSGYIKKNFKPFPVRFEPRTLDQHPKVIIYFLYVF